MGWADALQGAGAWFSGQGPQWENAQTIRNESLAQLDEKRRQAMLVDFRETYLDLKSGNKGRALQRLNERMGAIGKLGGDPSHTAELARMLQEGRDDEALQGLKMLDDRAVQAGALPSMADKKLSIQGGQAIYEGANGPYAMPIEGYDATLSGGADAVAPANQRLYEFYSQLSPAEQDKYREMVRGQQMVDLGGGLQGAVSGQQVVPLSRGGQSPDQMRNDYAGAEGDLAAVKSQSGELGAGAGKAANTAYESYATIRQSLKSYDKAIAAIDKGANSGKIASLFPTINAATIELENMGNVLGLDVVSTGKFGPLSEGELRMALSTAMPDLPPPELKSWLQQKKGAQEKLADYYAGVAKYLGKKGNTLPKYLEEQQANLEKSGALSSGKVVDWSEL